MVTVYEYYFYAPYLAIYQNTCCKDKSLFCMILTQTTMEGDKYLDWTFYALSFE